MATPAIHHYECAACGHTVTTAGPQRRADGCLVARLYCPTCGEVREVATNPGVRQWPTPLGVPIGPRHGPAGRLAAALARRLRRDDRLSSVTCPVCAHADLLLALVPGRELPCPHCECGQLRERPE
jgi:hypothetical protein